MLIKIAWRNLWRNKGRSLVIILSVVFGIWSGLFIQAFMNGLTEERLRLAIEKEISHLQVHHPGFTTSKEPDKVIANGKQVIEQIREHDKVKACTGRIITKGMLSTATGTTGITINGIDPVYEDSVTHLRDNISEGNYLSDPVKNEVMVGEKLMKKLKLRLNSKIVLTFLDRDNNITSGAFRIKAIFKTMNTPYEESNIFIDRNELASLMNVQGEIHEIAVLLHDNKHLDEVCQMISSKFPGFKTETWMQLSPEMELIVSTTGQSMMIYMSIIMLALAFGIINTMLMAVLERTREIGMLMALGMNRIRLFSMILIETVLLVFTGTPVGILLGFLSTSYFGRYGMDRSADKELYRSFGMSEIIYPKLNTGDYLIIIELVVITALISSIFPARKALSLNPSEAIRK